MKYKQLLAAILVIAGMISAAHSYAAASGLGTAKLSRGSTGTAVTALQNLLNEFSGSSLIADGHFGLATKAALQAFQTTKGLTPDGIMGLKTRTALEALGDPTVPVTQTVSVDNSFNKKSVSVKNGQELTVTLGNPSDGGYQFDAPVFDTDILSLVSHSHTLPTNPLVVGDGGTDTWTFRAGQAGTGNLKITISRNWNGGEKNQPYFFTTVTVQ